MVFVGRGNDRSWQKVRYPAEEGGSRASQFRRRGRLEALARPLRAPSSGQGRSPTQARGQAGTCRAGSGRAWQDAAPERLGGAGPGGRGGPGGGGRGWSGLAVGGPGAPWDLADTRTLLGPGSGPGTTLAPPLPVPLYGHQGETPGSLRLPACTRTLACCHGDQAPLPGAPPLLGQWNRPRTASLGDHLRASRAEPLLDWGTITRGSAAGRVRRTLAYPRSRSQVPLPRRRSPTQGGARGPVRSE